MSGTSIIAKIFVPLSQGRVFQETLNQERMPVKPGSRVLLGY